MMDGQLVDAMESSGSLAVPPEWRVACENIDLLLRLEMRPRGLAQGTVPMLYEFARRSTAEPLCAVAAREIIGRAGRTAVIFTGMVIPRYMPRGETDGPVGAIVLARALEKLRYRVSIVVEAELLPVVERLKSLAGVAAKLVNSYDLEDGDASEEIAAVAPVGIAIEKLGANGAGVRHTVGGRAVVTGSSTTDDVIGRIRRSGGWTLGIGDNGNEIGFGKFYAAAREVVPLGNCCRCPCGSGIVTSTATDFVIPAAVSNYGAYAVAAALAVICGDIDFCAPPEMVGGMLEEAAKLGCVNGGVEEEGFVGDDGIPLASCIAYAGLMCSIVSQYLKEVPPHN